MRRPWRLIACLWLAGGGTPLLADSPALPEKGICAHRGASLSHPENTLAAINEAVRLGAQQIEIDVRLTRDSQLVLLHDATITRTTNVRDVFPERDSHDVSEFTLAELKQLDAGSWFQNRFAGERIPTLEEAFEAIPPGTWVNLDLKGGADLAESVAREVLRLERAGQSLFSVRTEAAACVRRIASKANVRLFLNNMERRPRQSDYVAETIAGEFDFIQLREDPLQSQDDLRRLNEAGVKVNYFYTNSRDAIRELLQAGVDFPLVDDVATGMAVCEELGIPAARRPTPAPADK